MLCHLLVGGSERVLVIRNRGFTVVATFESQVAGAFPRDARSHRRAPRTRSGRPSVAGAGAAGP